MELNLEATKEIVNSVKKLCGRAYSLSTFTELDDVLLEERELSIQEVGIVYSLYSCIEALREYLIELNSNINIPFVKVLDHTVSAIHIGNNIQTALNPLVNTVHFYQDTFDTMNSFLVEEWGNLNPQEKEAWVKVCETMLD